MKKILSVLLLSLPFLFGNPAEAAAISPFSITSVIVKNSANTLRASWASATGATSYTIKYGTTNGSFTTTAATTTALTYDITGLTPGTKYYVMVTATNSTTSLNAKAAISATPMNTFALTSVTANSPTQVTLLWPTVKGAISYDLKYGTNSASIPYIASYTSPSSLVITSLTPGATYYFTMTATNTPSYLDATAAIAITMPAAIPNTPSGLSATSGNANVSLRWNVTSGATNYSVFRKISGASSYTALTSCTSITANTCTDLTALNGTSYAYSVSAANSSGSSGGSSSVTIKPVSSFTIATPTLSSANTMTLNWSAATGADTYTVQYGTDSAKLSTTSSATSSLSFSTNTFTAGTTYYFMVTANNSTGASTTATSLVSATLPLSPLLLTYANLTATVGTAITAISPTVTGGLPSAYLLTGTLPSGLSFNSSNGVISGTPKSILSLTTFSAQANNVSGSAHSTFSITVNPAATPTPTPVVFSGVPSSTLYQVSVTQAGVTKPNFVYVSKADTTGTINEGETNKTLHYSIFSGAGTFTVKVTKVGSKATAASIHPTRLGIGSVNAVVNTAGSSVTFTLSGPAKVSVEFNDDSTLQNGMVVMAQPAELAADVPSQTANNVQVVSDASTANLTIASGKTIVYFTPGVHQIGNWKIPTTVSQVYLADGAFLRGYFYADRTTGGPIKINGRGVLTNDIYPYHNVDANNVEIEFMLTLTGYTGGIKSMASP